jgi:hypothetical protein
MIEYLIGCVSGRHPLVRLLVCPVCHVGLFQDAVAYHR